MAELNDEVAAKIDDLSEKGEELFDSEKWDDAIDAYQSALNLLPEPKTDWEAFVWLNVAIGDSYFLSERFEKAFEFFDKTLTEVEAIENPFVHLRLGQCTRRIGDDEKALRHLLAAYMLGGEEIFEDEEEDFAFLRANADLSSPPGDNH